MCRVHSHTGKDTCVEVAATFATLAKDVLVPDGPYHVDDLATDLTATRWWAVCPREAGADLLPVKVTVSKADCMGPGAGRHLHIADCPAAVFVARRIPHATRRALAVATVVQADGGAAGRVGDGFERQQTVRFAGEPWQVEWDDSNVFLSHAGRRQWLFHMAGYTAAVVWAGDLDGDQKLDLLINDCRDTCSFLLLLSTAARGDEMVHPVAAGMLGECA